MENEGLLKDLVAPAPVKIEVVNDGELERMTTMYHSAQAKNEELSSKVQSLTVANEEKGTEYAQLNSVYKDLQIDTDDKIKKLEDKCASSQARVNHVETLRNDTLQENKNLKEQLADLTVKYEDSQHIAASYETHENELLEQIEYLEAQLERDKHSYKELVTVAKPILKVYVDNL